MQSAHSDVASIAVFSLWVRFSHPPEHKSMNHCQPRSEHKSDGDRSLGCISKCLVCVFSVDTGNRVRLAACSKQWKQHNLQSLKEGRSISNWHQRGGLPSKKRRPPEHSASITDISSQLISKFSKTVLWRTLTCSITLLHPEAFIYTHKITDFLWLV